jgi:hypothetical protein
MLYGLRQFDSIGLILHGSPEFVQTLPERLGFEEFGEMRETDWKPVTRPTDEIALPFGRRGLKRAIAARLVPQLYAHRYSLVQLQLERRACITRDKNSVWKESASLHFERRPHALSMGTRAKNLQRLLEATVWKRARVLLQMQGLTGVACVELVMPRPHGKATTITELSFDQYRGFSARPVFPHFVINP